MIHQNEIAGLIASISHRAVIQARECNTRYSDSLVLSL